MFDNVLNRGNVPKRSWGASSVISVFVYVLIGGATAWVSAHPEARERVEPKITFVAPRPPPPAPVQTPPPVQNRPKPKLKTPEHAVVVQQAIIAPREIPTQKPSEQPVQSQVLGMGDGYGDVANVAGGIHGEVIDSVDAPLEFNEEMSRPEYLSGPSPEYTQKAIEREVEGEMVVKCVVTVEGRVEDCRVLKSLPYMDRAVISALERRRYKPATLKGKPVTVDYTFRINLTLPQ